MNEIEKIIVLCQKKIVATNPSIIDFPYFERVLTTSFGHDKKNIIGNTYYCRLSFELGNSTIPFELAKVILTADIVEIKKFIKMYNYEDIYITFGIAIADFLQAETIKNYLEKIPNRSTRFLNSIKKIDTFQKRASLFSSNPIGRDIINTIDRHELIKVLKVIAGKQQFFLNESPEILLSYLESYCETPEMENLSIEIEYMQRVRCCEYFSNSTNKRKYLSIIKSILKLGINLDEEGTQFYNRYTSYVLQLEQLKKEKFGIIKPIIKPALSTKLVKAISIEPVYKKEKQLKFLKKNHDK